MEPLIVMKGAPVSEIYPTGGGTQTLAKFSDCETMSKKLLNDHGVTISSDRLREMAIAGYIPHYEIDGSGPYFRTSEAKDYIRRRFVIDRPARDFPDKLIVVDPRSKPIELGTLPPEISQFASQLFELPTAHLERIGVIYFLIMGTEVIYIGQTTTLASRISWHLEDKKGEFDRVFYMFVPIEKLIEVENQLIKAIRPPLNWIARNAAMATKMARKASA